MTGGIDTAGYKDVTVSATGIVPLDVDVIGELPIADVFVEVRVLGSLWYRWDVAVEGRTKQLRVPYNQLISVQLFCAGRPLGHVLHRTGHQPIVSAPCLQLREAAPLYAMAGAAA